VRKEKKSIDIENVHSAKLRCSNKYYYWNLWIFMEILYSLRSWQLRVISWLLYIFFFYCLFSVYVMRQLP